MECFTVCRLFIEQRGVWSGCDVQSDYTTDYVTYSTELAKLGAYPKNTDSFWDMLPILLVPHCMSHLSLTS